MTVRSVLALAGWGLAAFAAQAQTVQLVLDVTPSERRVAHMGDDYQPVWEHQDWLTGAPSFSLVATVDLGSYGSSISSFPPYQVAVATFKGLTSLEATPYTTGLRPQNVVGDLQQRADFHRVIDESGSGLASGEEAVTISAFGSGFGPSAGESAGYERRLTFGPLSGIPFDALEPFTVQQALQWLTASVGRQGSFYEVASGTGPSGDPNFSGPWSGTGVFGSFTVRSVSVVPEPSSAWLLGLGLAVAAAARARSRG